ncbi:uncharacterized protein LOC129251333 [Anastrepha obliqua]|uniref:uncharacterized protein LOC129251333 n=1 Tax=Anastrepha obliqua TaxID=95512 RepID=UPI002409C039|nr:uncharacterized protein LOC129251333 [Anastrepha obliqua]
MMQNRSSLFVFCRSSCEAGAAEQRQLQEIQQQRIAEVDKAASKATINGIANPTERNQWRHASTTRHSVGATLTSSAASTAFERPLAEVTGKQEQTAKATIEHKVITTTIEEVNKTAKIGESVTATVAAAAAAAAKGKEDGEAVSVGQHVAEIDTTTRQKKQKSTEYKPQRQQQVLHKQAQQQQQMPKLPDNERKSQQQQVQPQKRQQRPQEQLQRPPQQFDTMMLPTITTTTIIRAPTLESYSTAMPAKKYSGARLTTETKKFGKGSQQQQQQRQQQERQRQQESANKDAQPDNRNQRKQTRLEKSLQQRQQQRWQQREKQQPFNQKRLSTQKQNPQTEKEVQSHEQLQQDAQHVPQIQQQQQAQAQQRPYSTDRKQHVGVLIPSRILDVLHVQQGFHNFLDFFHVNLQNVSVDFIRDDDLSGFIKFLEHPKYTTVVKILNAGINLADDEMPPSGETASSPAEAAATVAAKSQRQSHQQQRQSVAITQINNATVAFTEAGEMKKSSTSSNAPLVAYCHLTEQLSRDFNKTVLAWPCPRMRVSKIRS